MIEKKFNNLIPKAPIKSPELVNSMFEKYKEYFNEIHINKSIEKTLQMSKYIDQSIDKLRIYNKSPKEAGSDLYVFLEKLRLIAWMLLPFMPETADRIFEQLGLDPKKEKQKKFNEAIKWGGLLSGTKIKKGKPLFPRLDR